MVDSATRIFDSNRSMRPAGPEFLISSRPVSTTVATSCLIANSGAESSSVRFVPKTSAPLYQPELLFSA